MNISRADLEVLLVFVAFSLAFILVYLAIPALVRVCKLKNLMDKSGGRKVHGSAVPAIGGVALFPAILISTIIATDGYSFDCLKYIIAAVILMFFVGLKDDILVISPRSKFLVQVAAALVLVLLGNVRLTNFQGLFGIYEVNYQVSLIASVFLVILVTNAFNLIDGVDGLLSGVTVLTAAILGIWFLEAGKVHYAFMSYAIVGAMAAFFIFNVFGKENKLFMGDTGALITGIMMGAIIIKFNEHNLIVAPRYQLNAAPAVAFAILAVPLFDTLRVFIIRLAHGRSPFHADRNHMHHLWLDLTGSHLKTTIAILSGNVVIIAMAYWMSVLGMNVNALMLLVAFMGLLLVGIPYVLIKLRILVLLRALRLHSVHKD